MPYRAGTARLAPFVRTRDAIDRQRSRIENRMLNVDSWPRLPRKTYKSPPCGSRFSVSCTCSAKPFMPRRMSVRPTASHTRIPLGTGIIAAARPRSPPPPRPAGSRPECAPAIRRRPRSRSPARPRERKPRRTSPQREAVPRPLRQSRHAPDPTPAASGRSGSCKRPSAARPPKQRPPARTLLQQSPAFAQP